MRVKTPSIPKDKPASFSPVGPSAPAAAFQMEQPNSGGGGGFLINHNAFTDARPPSPRGMRKSTGYPSFAKNP